MLHAHPAHAHARGNALLLRVQGYHELHGLLLLLFCLLLTFVRTCVPHVGVDIKSGDLYVACVGANSEVRKYKKITDDA